MLLLRVWLCAACLLLIGSLPGHSTHAALSSSAALTQTTDLIAARVAELSLEQKIGQLFMVTLHGTVQTQAGADFLRTFQPGAVSVFTANVTDPPGLARLTNDWQRTITDAGGVPLLIAVDQEGGLVARLTETAGFTVFPAPVVLAAAGPAATERAAAFTAQQLRAVGIHMNLAPVADLETNPDNPIIWRRAFGSDPAYTADIIAAYTRGLHSGGVMATLKHFPGHGEAAEDSHAVLQTLDLSAERLASTELVPFAAGIEAGAAAVMVAHIHYPAYDAERLPASLSPTVIGGVLRGQLGFDGLVLTDALDMNAIDLEFPFSEAAVRAIAAGVDVLVLGPSAGLETAQNAFAAVLDAVQSGRLSEAQIDAAVTRILTAKAAYGLLNDAPPLVDAVNAVQAVAAADGAALVTETVGAAVTVVYDDGDHVPLPADRTAAVIFPGTQYGIQRACAAHRPDLRWLAYNPTPNPDEIAAAARLAAEVDTTFVWTENAIRSPELAALVNALPPERTVAIAMWSPYDWTVYPGVSGYVALYTPHPAAIPAGCAVLLGAQPSTGRFPFTLPPRLFAGMGE